MKISAASKIYFRKFRRIFCHCEAKSKSRQLRENFECKSHESFQWYDSFDFAFWIIKRRLELKFHAKKRIYTTKKQKDFALEAGFIIIFFYCMCV